MQVTEKPKTVCVECKWYQKNYQTVHQQRSRPSWSGNTVSYEIWYEKQEKFLGTECVSPQQTVWDTVTGEHTIDPDTKNDGNCQDYEAKAPQ